MTGCNILLQTGGKLLLQSGGELLLTDCTPLVQRPKGGNLAFMLPRHKREDESQDDTLAELTSVVRKRRRKKIIDADAAVTPPESPIEITVAQAPPAITPEIRLRPVATFFETPVAPAVAAAAQATPVPDVDVAALMWRDDDIAIAMLM